MVGTLPLCCTQCPVSLSLKGASVWGGSRAGRAGVRKRIEPHISSNHLCRGAVTDVLTTGKVDESHHAPKRAKGVWRGRTGVLWNGIDKLLQFFLCLPLCRSPLGPHPPSSLIVKSTLCFTGPFLPRSFPMSSG